MTSIEEKIHTLPLVSIKIRDRMRKDIGDLSGLMDSIKRHGLIHPIVIDHENFLIGGERRFRAHEALKLETIRCIYRDQAPIDVQSELEFEENFWRKSMSWQEEALGILNIYRKKKSASALEGWLEPYQQVVSRMFGMSVGTINYILAVAKKLEKETDPNGRWHSYNNASEAFRLGIIADEEDRIEKYNAEELKRRTNTIAQQAETKVLAEKAAIEINEIKQMEASPDSLDLARRRYASNPLNVVPFDQYIKEKREAAEKFSNEVKNTIYITNRFYHVHCIKFMNDPSRNALFDHIITDPPYAIDMSNMNQNTEGRIVAIERVIGAHQVNENLELLKNFFPAAWHCTKNKAYVVVCCDISNWQYLKDLALNAGFLVQDWPYIWRKLNQSVANNAAQYNTTKDYEIVMICRKPATAVATKRNTSFTDASNVQVIKDTGHPFAKPYELTRDLCEMISMKGQLILDPFAGGGSMVIQMLRMEREVIACEKEEHHFNSLLGNVKNLFYLTKNPNYIFK